MENKNLENIKGKKVLVVGMGKSGIAAVQAMLALGAEVAIQDSKDRSAIDGQLLNFLEGKNVTCYFHAVPVAEERFDMLILSPGVDPALPFVQEAKAHGAEVIGELEIAYRIARGTFVAITGTNGKTTTTTLTGEIFKRSGRKTYVVGNIGVAVISKALEADEDDWLVTETSSFQLETIMDFRPDVSAILNITPDHLNRHHTMECYIAVKESITSNQTEEDTCVLNYDDKVLREFGQSEELKPKVIFFSSRQKLDDGYYLDGDMIYYAKNKKAEAVLDVRELNLLGRHNYENVMAAIAISRAMGVPMETIVKVAKEFKAVEHRIEFVLERSGVKYYNDSKGTNPDAAIQAIRAMPGPTLLIAGGYDKQSTYDEWIEAFDGKVKYLVLIGQTRDKIAECAKAHGFYDIMYAEDMSEAVRVCASYANMGDNVLLSPACASWGMFKNYEERGRIFKECVRSL